MVSKQTVYDTSYNYIVYWCLFRCHFRLLVVKLVERFYHYQLQANDTNTLS